MDLISRYDMFHVYTATKITRCLTMDITTAPSLTKKCVEFISLYRESSDAGVIITAKEVLDVNSTFEEPPHKYCKMWQLEYEGQIYDYECNGLAEIFKQFYTLTPLMFQLKCDLSSLNLTWRFSYSLEKLLEEKFTTHYMALTNGNCSDFDGADICVELGHQMLPPGKLTRCPAVNPL